MGYFMGFGTLGRPMGKAMNAVGLGDVGEVMGAIDDPMNLNQMTGGKISSPWQNMKIQAEEEEALQNQKKNAFANAMLGGE